MVNSSQTSSHAVLLTWNPKKTGWMDFQDEWEAFCAGYELKLDWSCGNSRYIQVGDRVYLMRLGHLVQNQGIAASGLVTRTPYYDEHWDREREGSIARYVEFTVDWLRNPTTETLPDPTHQIPEFNWHPQSSGVRIPLEIAERLDVLLQICQNAGPSALAGLQTEAEHTYKEGKQFRISANRYERDPRARAACIEHYGAFCQVCGLDFALMYGELGEGYIHVHHLVPISAQGQEYRVDPVRDLIPICPNCHAMLHRDDPPVSIDHLREIVQQQTQLLEDLLRPRDD